MNKNMGNHKRKGPPRGQMQNKGKGEKELQGEERNSEMERGKNIHRVNPSAEHSVNREREVPRSESWTIKKEQEEQKIHPVELSDENIQPREKETHRMVSWNREHKEREREIYPDENEEENKALSEVEILEAKSQAAKNTDSVDGYDATVRAKMYNQDPVVQPSPTHVEPEDKSLMDDIRSAPAMGTVLITVAVLLVIGWVIGFFFYNASDLIHVLLVMALFAVLIKVAQGKSELG